MTMNRLACDCVSRFRIVVASYINKSALIKERNDKQTTSKTNDIKCASFFIYHENYLLPADTHLLKQS